MLAPTVNPEWVLHPRHDPERALGLARALGAPLPVAHALVNRGVAEAAEARRFLEPSLDDLHDPFDLLDLDRAVERIGTALAGGEGILVHGDYDADGVTSTFLLADVLAGLGGRVETHIPHRTRDGYGLSESGIELARRRGCSLIVTVDCGITAVEQVESARAHGIDTVVTDHHEPPAVLPRAHALVNPHRRGCRYPFKSLAGVGVSFKLAQALLRGHGGLERARQYLDVVALGTIADVVPLVGENRVLARHGLQRLARTGRPGLRALIESANMKGDRVTGGQVAFLLAPRINAAGRMGNAEQGLRLLQARDADEARACAESLEEDNQRRREHDERALAEAERLVAADPGAAGRASLVLWSERWHPGVIGIVAARLVERFQRPTVLVALDGGLGRGSGRSLPGLDLNRVFERCSDLLETWGGHSFAAGLTVRGDRLPELRDRIERLVVELRSADSLVPRVVADADLSLRECDLELVDWLERLAPYGLDNGEPLFRARDLTVESAGAVGGGKHLRLSLRDGSGAAEAIGFGFGERAAELRTAGRCDVLFVPTRNEWKDQTRLQLKLKAVRAA